MSREYSTIQQHEPLRTPSGWNQQERMLVVQLDEILDDIYRRFGRLTIEDFGKALKKTIEDAEGNIASLLVDVSGITLEVQGLDTDVTNLQNNKYTIRSGIDIKVAGIEISGGKYIDIKSGCTLDIESGGNMNIKSGGNLKIQAGGSLDVDTNNFVLDSTNKKMQCGTWTFDQNGITDQVDALNKFCLKASGGDLLLSLGRQASAGAAVVDSNMRLTVGNPVYQSTSIGGEPMLDFGQGNFWGMVGDNHTPLTEVWTKYICSWSQQQQSSREVKSNIEDLPEQGEVIDALKPVSYEYDQIPGEKRFGLIWEDTVGVLPEICSGDPTGDADRKAIKYTDMIAVLLKEIQSLRKRVAQLEERVG